VQRVDPDKLLIAYVLSFHRFRVRQTSLPLP
jgi:hypothetical protein